MAKNDLYIKKRDGHKRFLINNVADMHGVSPRTVDRVLNGDSENEEVLDTYMTLKEGFNFLLEAVKELVPFESQPKTTKHGI